MSKKDTSLKDRDLLAEFFLIIGGFILAETIITRFLSLSSETLPEWVLPLYSILLIITALNFKHSNQNFFKAGGLSILFLGFSIGLVVLLNNNLVTNLFFISSILVSFIMLLITIIWAVHKRKL